jgi:hypothetical protein
MGWQRKAVNMANAQGLFYIVCMTRDFVNSPLVHPMDTEFVILNGESGNFRVIG